MKLNKPGVELTGSADKIYFNVGFRSVQTTIEMVGSFLITVIIARMLGTDALGAFVFAKALTMIIHALLSFGMVHVLIRDIAQQPRLIQRIAGNGLAFRLLVTIPALLGMTIILGRLLPVNATTQNIMLLAALTDSIGNTMLLLSGVFQAMSRFQYPLLLTAVRKVGLLLIAWLLPQNGFNIVGILVGFVGIHALVLFWTWILVNRKVTIVKLRFDWTEWRRLFRQSLPLALSDFAYATNGRADSILLGMVRSLAEVGIYGAAFNLYLGLGVVVNSIAIGGFPILSQRAAISRRSAVRLAISLGSVLLVATGVIALIGSILAKQIVLFIYGHEMSTAADILPILLLALVFSSLGRLCHFTMIGIGFQRVVLWTTLLGTSFNILVNLIVIPLFGYVGAAHTTLITQFLVLSLSLAFLLRCEFVKDTSATETPSAEDGTLSETMAPYS